MRGVDSRRTAVEVLLKVQRGGAFANIALDAAFRRRSLSERDRAFATCLVQGVLRHQAQLDGIIAAQSERPLDRLSASLLVVLRVALFQLIHMDDIPESAVLNTATEIARKTGHEGTARFANGFLRRWLRSRAEADGKPDTRPERESQDSDLDREPGQNRGEGEDSASGDGGALVETADGAAALSARYSLPEWLVERWRHRFGPEESFRLFAFSQSVPPLTLRTCELAVTPSGLAAIFEAKKLKIERGELVPSCLIVRDRGPISGPVTKIPGYDEGLFAVQDEAAAFVAIAAAPEPGQFVVDLCAAPGGKSLHLGELMQNKGRVLAVDTSAGRLNMLGRERRRLGLTNIEIAAADGRDFSCDPADIVLLDAPCTGTGVINRRTDLRHKRKAEELKKLVELQRALLSNAARLVKPGGTLVYSTCSIEREENEDNLDWFLSGNEDFRGDSLRRFFPDPLISRWAGQAWWPETAEGIERGFIQLLPTRHGTSGFFISRLKRS